MDPARPTNRLLVLGPVSLTKPDGTAARSVLAQPKRVALLTYLRLAGRGRPVTRDAVLGAFWPELPEDRALNSLRQAIHFLRRSLGEGIVERPGDHLLHVPVERLWCDADALTASAEAGDHEAAMALYRGPFLDGIPLDGPNVLEEWIEGTRRSYQRLAVESASGLAESALKRDQPVAAADSARRLIELDPLEERGVALLIDSHAMEGDLVSALRAFHEYADRLERALDLAPSAELRARVESLRQESAADPDQTAGIEDPVERAEAPSSRTEGVLGRDATQQGPGAPAPGHPTDAPATPAQAQAQTQAHAASDPVPSEATPNRSATPRSFASLPAAAFVLVVLAVGGILGLRALSDEGPTVPPPLLRDATEGRPSVAVLPFSNLSGDSANAFFVSGVHESVIVTLARIGALDVSGLQAVRTYAGTTLDHGRIAEELGVSALMSGSVQRADDRVRIIVELVDSRSGRQIWSEVFDRRLDDVFGVQSEIAASVASSLSAVLTPVEETRIAHRPTESVEALDAYMRGREAYREISLGSMDRAIGHFEAAVAADSGFAPAWAGIADAMLQRVQFFGYPLTWADSAGILLQHAIQLDAELPEAHKTLGFVHSVFGREQASLEANLRALELRPAYAEALNNAGWAQYALGELAEAERLIGRAFRLDPTIPQLRSNVGAIWAALGRVEEAEAWLDAVLAAEPGLTAARQWRVFLDHERADPEAALARAEAYLGDEDPVLPAYARAAYAALLARDLDALRRYTAPLGSPESVTGVPSSEPPGRNLFGLRRAETLRGMALRLGGDPTSAAREARLAIQAVNRAIGGGADGWDPPMELAAAYAVVGDAGQTLRHLTEAVDRGFPHASLLRLDPTFDLVRDDSGFAILVRRVEARAEEQRRRSLGQGG